MSHVISSQPSAASPYKTTATEIPDSDTTYPPRIVTGEGRNTQECCFRVDENDGCCLYVFCRIFSRCCQFIGDSTESCCDACATCLADCCEDKPSDENRRRYIANTDSAYYDGTSTDYWAGGGNEGHLLGSIGDENRVDTYNIDTGFDDMGKCDTVTDTACDSRGSDFGGTDTHCETGRGDCGGTDTACDSGGRTDTACDTGGGDCGGTDTCCDSGGGGGDSGGGCDAD